jgi:8-oxo-dGTP diphosphatase
LTEVGAFAALFDEHERLLLCRRRDVDLWEMPGGRVEPDESPWDAVRREVAEEVGMSVDVRRLTGLYWRPEREVLVLQFECHGEGDPTTSLEVREARYFELDHLPEPMNPPVVERVGDLRDVSSGLHMRIQHGPSGDEWASAWQKERRRTAGT